MSKNKEFVTFAQQRHNEYLYNVFTIFFIVGSLMALSQAAFGGCADWFFGTAPENQWIESLKILMSAVYAGAGVYLPFLIYNVVCHKNSGRYFTKSIKKTSAATCICAVLAVVGIGIFIQYLSSLAAQYLRQTGLLLREALPDTGSNIVTNILFILCNALIPTFFQEITFRGIVIENTKKDSHTAAIIISALLGSLTFTSIQQAPHLLFTGLILGWLYLKTENLRLTYLCNAVLNGLLAIKWAMTCSVGRPFLQKLPVLCAISGGVGLVALIILFAQLKFKTEHKPEDRPLSGKDSAKALGKSFALWLFIIISVFRVLFGYIAKPNPNYTGIETKITTQNQDGNG